MHKHDPAESKRKSHNDRASGDIALRGLPRFRLSQGYRQSQPHQRTSKVRKQLDDPGAAEQLDHDWNRGASDPKLDNAAMRLIKVTRHPGTKRDSGPGGENQPGEEKSHRLGKKNEGRIDGDPGQCACNRP